MTIMKIYLIKENILSESFKTQYFQDQIYFILMIKK